ncbi:hypothetical protein FRB90_012781 [Tulasnella sp. 427]|nr:hypothetical protein FRB90_012781 [Tulasnella sp. 427]
MTGQDAEKVRMWTARMPFQPKESRKARAARQLVKAQTPQNPPSPNALQPPRHPFHRPSMSRKQPQNHTPSLPSSASASSSTHTHNHPHHHLFHRTSQPPSASSSYAPSASSSVATTPTTQHAHTFQTDVVTNKHAVLGTHDRSGRKMVNQYIVMEVIGKGMHGTVRRGIDSRTGDIVAIKIVERVPKHKRLGMYARQHHTGGGGGGGRPHSRVGPGAVTQQLRTTEAKIKREIAIMKKCGHGNVVQLKEVIDDPHNKRIFLILEYMEGGELKWRSPPPDESPTLEVEKTRQIFRQVILGLEYLHYQGIIHRDIKPANLLVKSDGTVKISDFGVSQFSYALRLQSAGTNAIRTSSPSPQRPPPKQQDSTDDAGGMLSSPSGTSYTHVEEDVLMDESDLCKTAGSPAFFAPELCYQGGSLGGAFGSFPSFGGAAGGGAGSSLPSPTTFGGAVDEMFGGGGLPSSAPLSSAGMMMLAVPNSESAGSVGVGRTPSSSTSSHSHVGQQPQPPAAPPQQQQQVKERSSRPKFLPSRQQSSNSSSVQTAPISIPSSPTTTQPPNLAAPPPVTAAIDIWALGVTLYCLLFGKPPFNAPTEFMLYKIIPNEDFVVPERMGKDQKKTGGRWGARDARRRRARKGSVVGGMLGRAKDKEEVVKEREREDELEGYEVVEILERLLEKDPTKRITLHDLKRMPWVLRGIPDPDLWLIETDPRKEEMVVVQQEDVEGVFRKAKLKDKLKKFKEKTKTTMGLLGRLRSRSTSSVNVLGGGGGGPASVVGSEVSTSTVHTESTSRKGQATPTGAPTSSKPSDEQDDGHLSADTRVSFSFSDDESELGEYEEGNPDIMIGAGGFVPVRNRGMGWEPLYPNTNPTSWQGSSNASSPAHSPLGSAHHSSAAMSSNTSGPSSPRQGTSNLSLDMISSMAGGPFHHYHHAAMMPGQTSPLAYQSFSPRETGEGFSEEGDGDGDEEEDDDEEDSFLEVRKKSHGPGTNSSGPGSDRARSPESERRLGPRLSR